MRVISSPSTSGTSSLPSSPSKPYFLALCWVEGLKSALSCSQKILKVGTSAPRRTSAVLKLFVILSNKALYFQILSDEEFGASAEV